MDVLYHGIKTQYAYDFPFVFFSWINNELEEVKSLSH